MTWRFLTWLLGDVVPSTERKIRRMIMDFWGRARGRGSVLGLDGRSLRCFPL